jgi:hypothetical protein
MGVISDTIYLRFLPFPTKYPFTRVLENTSPLPAGWRGGEKCDKKRNMGKGKLKVKRLTIKKKDKNKDKKGAGGVNISKSWKRENIDFRGVREEKDGFKTKR